MHHLDHKIKRDGKKKLLTLDGGGIRGIMTVEILAGVEAMLREKLGADDSFRLSHYFDYVGGTSTGAIIATCVSLGMRVSEIRDFYVDNGEAMFDKAGLLRRFRYKFDDERLAAKLREVLSVQKDGRTELLTLGSEQLQTLLLVVMRNATTDSPWPLSNNPHAKYNAPERKDSNLKLPLWQIVRASTAAPVYFPPEVVRVGDKEFVFVDGGITPYNNPAFLIFLMSTVGAYRLGWETGADRMLIVSVGTGSSPDANEDLAPGEMNLLYNAGSIPSALMYAASNEQDLLCRVFGDCRVGDQIDREVEDLIDRESTAASASVPGLRPKLFTYLRYNAELSRAGLDALGLPNVDPRQVQTLDAVDRIPELQEVGRAVVKSKVRPEHFEGFLR
jgi:patatin-like phospholipase/acyl hydrolase